MKFPFVQSLLPALPFLLAALFAPAASRASVQTLSQFDGTDSVITFATGTTLLPTVPGVHFAGGDAPFSAGGFGPQYFGNLLGPGGYSYLDITYDQPQHEVGANLVKATPSVAGVTEVVYDQNNHVLETESALFSQGFLGIAQAGNTIYKVEWQYSSPGFFGVGNVIYGTVVPEPTPLALMAGAGVLFTFRRAVGRRG